MEKADSIYDKFVLGIMGNKTLTFNPDVFTKVAKLLAPFYLNREKKTEDEFPIWPNITGRYLILN